MKNTRKSSTRNGSTTSHIGKPTSRQRKNLKGSPSERWIRLRRADLLSKASDAEKYAYQILLALGYSVIRQHPINTGRRIYFADLYIPSLRIVIECDGGYHYTTNQKRLDNNRSCGIWRLGYHVVRLSNRDARDPEKIQAKIRLILGKSSK